MLQACLSSLPCSGALSSQRPPAGVLSIGLSPLPGGQPAPPLSCLRCVPTGLKLCCDTMIKRTGRARPIILESHHQSAVDLQTMLLPPQSRLSSQHLRLSTPSLQSSCLLCLLLGFALHLHFLPSAWGTLQGCETRAADLPYATISAALHGCSVQATSASFAVSFVGFSTAAAVRWRARGRLQPELMPCRLLPAAVQQHRPLILRSQSGLLSHRQRPPGQRPRLRCHLRLWAWPQQPLLGLVCCHQWRLRR